MADATTLREFVVALGFRADPTSQKKMTDAIQSVTKAAAGLGTTIEKAATTAAIGVAKIVAAFEGIRLAARGLDAAVEGLAKIADGMERLYFASTRTMASVGNIQALGFAAANMGSSAAAAQGSLEALAHFLRSSPGAAGLLNHLGIATQIGGHARDATDIMGDLGQTFAKMPFYRAQSYASMFGIDEKTLIAMRQGMGQFSAQYKGWMQAAGLDADKAAKSSHDFMIALRSLGAVTGIVWQKVASTLTDGAGGSLVQLRKTIVANFTTISRIIGGGAKALLHVAEVIVVLASHAASAMADLSSWFGNLDGSTKKAIEAFGALLIAWRAFNLGFAMTPIGAIITGIAAIGAAIFLLYDDFKAWERGDTHLIPWEKWEPQIKEAKAGIKEFQSWLKSKFADIKQYLSTVDWSVWLPDINSLKDKFGQLGAALAGLWKALDDVRSHLWALFGDDILAALRYGRDTLFAIGNFQFHLLIGAIKFVTALLRGDWAGAWAVAKDAFTTWVTFIEDRFTALGELIKRVIKDIFGKFEGGDDYITKKVAEFKAAGGVIRRAWRWVYDDVTKGVPTANWGAGAPPQGEGNPGQGVGAHIGLSPKAQKDAVKAGMDFFSQRWGVAHAAGIVAQAMGESGMDPSAVNPASGAGSTFQWLGPRKAAIEARYHKPISQLTLMESFEAYQYELMHNEAHSAANLNAATTPGQSAYVMERFNERNLNDYAHSPRIPLAEKLARDYQNSQNVNVNTTINLQPGPDAHTTAKAIVGEQGKTAQRIVGNMQARAS